MTEERMMKLLHRKGGPMEHHRRHMRSPRLQKIKKLTPLSRTMHDERTRKVFSHVHLLVKKVTLLDAIIGGLAQAIKANLTDECIRLRAE